MPVIKNETLRNILKYLIPFVLIPASVALGFVIFNDKRFAFVTLAVVILAFILFIAGFESKKTGSRRLVLAAVFVALSVAGRFIPFFKPVTAITILAAIYLGGETGFLVGSLSAVLSNFYFGQGPWTPFQMFAWGMIGLIAGLLHRPLVKSRILLIVYGLLSGIFFSFIMDIWTVLWYNGTFDISYYLSAITAAIPYTILYSVSNVLFLLLFAKPFGEKLSRVKIKYGV